MSTTTREKIHPLTLISRELSPPLVHAENRLLSGVDSKDSLLTTIGNERRSHSAEAIVSSGSVSFAQEFQLRENSATLSVALRNHPFYNKYFIHKINNIRRLETEIEKVEAMNYAEYAEYRDSHCPLLKGKSELISNNLFFIRYYTRQIKNTLEQSKWKNY